MTPAPNRSSFCQDDFARPGSPLRRELFEAILNLDITGGVVLVDDADAALVTAHPWWAADGAGRTRYAITRGGIPMHRLIMAAPKGVEVDHVNGDGLDNRRANLRLATRAQNAKNRPAQNDCASPFKGVMIRKGRNGGATFVVAIQQDRERMKIGAYPSEHAAARAYDAAAKLFHGKFARTNKDMGLFEKHPDRTAKDFDQPRKVRRRYY